MNILDMAVWTSEFVTAGMPRKLAHILVQGARFRGPKDLRARKWSDVSKQLKLEPGIGPKSLEIIRRWHGGFG